MRYILTIIYLFQLCCVFSYAQTAADLPALIPFKQKGLFGFKTQNNQIAIAPIYKNVTLFVHGKAIVSKQINGKRLTGVIDTTGREVVPIKYRLLYGIYNDGRGFETNGFIAAGACFTVIIDDEKYINKMGVLDRNGDLVLEPDYYGIEAFYKDSLGIVFKVRKRIESDTKMAIYSSSGKCLYPFGQGNVFSEWRNQLYGLPKKVEPTQEQLLQADTTKAYTYVQGLKLRGFSAAHAIVRDKKTMLYGVYNLETKKYILPPTFSYIMVLCNAHLVCTSPNKTTKKLVYNQAYQAIDSLDSKREFDFLWDNQFSLNKSFVVYSSNYISLNKPGLQRPKFNHYPALGLMLIIDGNINKASLFDTLGKLVFDINIPTKYLYDEPGFEHYVKDELKNAESIDSIINILRIGFAPLAENISSNKYRTSPDGQIYYARYGGKLVAMPAKDVERLPMIKRDGVKLVFEFINGKQILLPEELRYLLLFGTDSMYAAKHITSNQFYQVDLTGKLRLLNNSERLALIARINAGVKPMVNNCFSCTFQNSIMLNQNWMWEYQAFSSNDLSIPLPILVPQAGPASAQIDLSTGQYFFFHRTTLQVYGVYKKKKHIEPTPYYALFRINKKNGDLKFYQIKKFGLSNATNQL